LTIFLAIQWLLRIFFVTWQQRDRRTLTLDAAAVVAEEAAERKEARRVKPWLSELDVDVPQELAGDRLGWRKMLKSIKIRT
jgi:hypothetical protein